MIFDRGLVEPGTTAGYTEESIEAGQPQFPGNGQFNPGTQPFLKVNLKGQRFALESADYDYLPHAAAQQPGGVYISVWDGNFGEDVQRFHTLGCSAMTRNMVLGSKKEDGTYDLDKFFEKELADGRLQKADTLDELADKLGFDAEAKKTFLATCERYNELYDNQEDVDFGKEAYRLSELRTPPFFGATLGGTLLTTIDGVRINADCQALNADFEPIEGLYCRRRLLGLALQRQLPRPDARRGVRPHDDRGPARGEAHRGDVVPGRARTRCVRTASPALSTGCGRGGDRDPGRLRASRLYALPWLASAHPLRSIRPGPPLLLPGHAAPVIDGGRFVLAPAYASRRGKHRGKGSARRYKAMRYFMMRVAFCSDILLTSPCFM